MVLLLSILFGCFLSPTPETTVSNHLYSSTCPEGWVFIVQSFSNTSSIQEELYESYIDVFTRRIGGDDFKLSSSVTKRYCLFDGIQTNYTGSLFGGASGNGIFFSWLCFYLFCSDSNGS